MTDTLHRFSHQRLEAYRYAIELFAGVEGLAATFPAGHADLKDQLRRADRISRMLTGLVRRQRARL